jgi:hypothetical protein
MPTQQCFWTNLVNGKPVRCTANATIAVQGCLCKSHRDAVVSPGQYKSKEHAAAQQATRDKCSQRDKRQKTALENEAPEDRKTRLAYKKGKNDERDFRTEEYREYLNDYRRSRNDKYDEEQAILKNAWLAQEAARLGVPVESLRDVPTLHNHEADAIVKDILKTRVCAFILDELGRKFLFAHLKMPLFNVLADDGTVSYFGINIHKSFSQQPSTCKAEIGEGFEAGEADAQVSRLSWTTVATCCRVAGAVDRRCSSKRCSGETRSTTGSATVKKLY